jgi:16S rRNA C1402 N4-methylase RsmH
MHQNKKQKEYEEHIPVLLGEVLQYLDPSAEESYLDLTAGYAGHAEAVLDKTHAPQQAVLVDRDENSIKVLKDKFSDTDIDLRQMDFLSAAMEVVDRYQHLGHKPLSEAQLPHRPVSIGPKFQNRKLWN